MEKASEIRNLAARARALGYQEGPLTRKGHLHFIHPGTKCHVTVSTRSVGVKGKLAELRRGARAGVQNVSH